MIPRVGEAVDRNRRYVARPGAYAVLERSGEVLLTFQESPVPEFQLPGGGIDPGEAMLPALHREIREETGWRVSGKEGAAELLGLKPTTLESRMKKLGIKRKV